MNKNKYLIVIFIVFTFIFTIYNLANIRESISNMDDSSNIIGYIHICQKGEWKKSYDLLMNSLKMQDYMIKQM